MGLMIKGIYHPKGFPTIFLMIQRLSSYQFQGGQAAIHASLHFSTPVEHLHGRLDGCEEADVCRFKLRGDQKEGSLSRSADFLGSQR